MLDETFAAAGRMSHFPMLLEQARRVRKGVTPSEVVYEEDRLKLLHYIPQGEPRYRTPLVFIYALVNRPYILDLKKGRSVIANFVERGIGSAAAMIVRAKEHLIPVAPKAVLRASPPVQHQQL